MKKRETNVFHKNKIVTIIVNTKTVNINDNNIDEVIDFNVNTTTPFPHSKLFLNNSLEERNVVNILCLNCCGLQKRLNYPEFYELISKYDILCLVESKSDDLDFFNIPGYEVKMKNREKVAKGKNQEI